jgi:hypothetical protein
LQVRVHIDHAELLPWRHAEHCPSARFHQDDHAILPHEAHHQRRLLALDHAEDTTTPKWAKSTKLPAPYRARGPGGGGPGELRRPTTVSLLLFEERHDLLQRPDREQRDLVVTYERECRPGLLAAELDGPELGLDAV